jgi:hypothetical protein
MKQIARLLMAALTLTGCARKSVIQEETDELVGKPLSAVTTKLGTPTEEHEMDGSRVYIWSSGAEGGGSQGNCTIRVVTRGDLIGSFDWEGTEGQCANYALMLKGSDCREGITDVRVWLPVCRGTPSGAGGV